jgi:hypothetical protein
MAHPVRALAWRRKTVVRIWWPTNDYERLATACLVHTHMSKPRRFRRWFEG